MTTKTSIPISDRYGYIIIDTPELKQKYAPFQTGDEKLYSDGGFAVPIICSGFCSCHTFRRPIPVGTGFELVGLDCVIGSEDSCFTEAGNWGGHGWAGNTPRQAFTECPRLLAFRRRKSDSLNGWVRISDRLPKAEEYPVWVTDGKEVETANHGYERDCGERWSGKPYTEKQGVDFDRTLTHWQPKPKEVKPLPPAPEKSEEEIAFEKAFAIAEKHIEKECAELGHRLASPEHRRERHLATFQAGVTFAKSKPAGK